MTWVTGVVAFMASIVECFTGYVSQQNFDSQWISASGKDAFNGVGVGAFFNLMNVGQMLLWHVVLIPVVLVALVGAHVSPMLRSRSSVTAVTHSLPVIQEIGAWEGPHLVALGGLFLADYEAFVGPQTVASLKSLSADLAFLGCDGLTIEAGITTPHVLVAEVGATMAGRARRVVALADSSKLGRPGFTTIVPLSQVDVLITDAGASPEQLATIRAAGIEVIVA